MPTDLDDLVTPENKAIVTIQSQTTGFNPSAQDLSISSQASNHNARLKPFRPIWMKPWWVRQIIILGRFCATIPNSIEPGYRTLKVRAVDELGAIAEQTVQINITASQDQSLSGFNLLSPQKNESWSRSTFPRTFIVHTDEPTRYLRITINPRE